MKEATRFHRHSLHKPAGLGSRKELEKEGREEKEEEEEVGHEGGTVPTVYTVTRTKTWRNGTLALCKSVKRLKDSPHALPSPRSFSFFSTKIHLPRLALAILSLFSTPLSLSSFPSPSIQSIHPSIYPEKIVFINWERILPTIWRIARGYYIHSQLLYIISAS